MTRDEYISVSSEISELESLLAGIPQENVINRWSLEQRLQSVRSLIEFELAAPVAVGSGQRVMFTDLKGSKLPNNVKEGVETYSGEFQGVLPTSRTFEFKVSDHGSVLRGKIAAAIEDPDELNRNHLHKPVTVRLAAITVGQGRPRYTLRTLADITG